LSVRGLPCGPPNKSSAIRMCRLARIAGHGADRSVVALVHDWGMISSSLYIRH
jgi:hypothetical protein